MAAGDGAKEPRLALPRRASQPAPLPRVLAAKPVDLRVPGRIPMFTPPNSVTIRKMPLAGYPAPQYLQSVRVRKVRGRASKAMNHLRSRALFPRGSDSSAITNESFR